MPLSAFSEDKNKNLRNENHIPSEAFLTDDPFFWVSGGSSLIFSYFISSKLKYGIEYGLPVCAGYIAIAETAISSLVFKKVSLQITGVTFPAVGLIALFAAKSVMTCPKTGHSGCTCGLN